MSLSVQQIIELNKRPSIPGIEPKYLPTESLAVAASEGWIWFGDSLAGSGVTSSDPADFGIIQDAKIFYKPDRLLLNNGRWETYDGMINSYVGGVSPNTLPRIMGPQHTFLQAKVARGKKVRLFKLNVGGSSFLAQTSTGNDWKRAAGELYTVLHDYIIYPGLRTIPSSEPFTLKGVIMQLGTNDAQASIYNASFGADMKTFITDIRQDLAMPNLKFVIVKIRTALNVEGTSAGTRTQAAAVRTDYTNIGTIGHANYVANVDFVEVDDFTMQADGLHYDLASNKLLGTRVDTVTANY